MILDFDIIELTREEIFKRITPHDIYSFYLNEPIVLGKKYHSIFREDRNPSLSFWENEEKVLLWRDWGDPTQLSPKDAISFVMKLFNCSYNDALVKIDQDFLLGILNNKQIILNQSTPKIKTSVSLKGQKEYATIFVERKPFSTTDIKFWNRYNISLQTLSYYDVFPVKRVFINRKLHIGYKTESPVYAYKFNSPKKTFYKIYAPYETSKKWRTNCPHWCLQGYSQLPATGNLLIITKSLKDVMVLYEMGYNTIAPQSETIIKNDKIIDELTFRFKKIIVFFDNDKQGLISGKLLSEKINCENIYIPKETVGEKDISDVVKRYSFQYGKELIKKMLNG